MKRIIKILWIMMPATLLAGILVCSCGNERTLSPDEAIKSIKALDSDLTNLVTAAGEQKAIKGLKFLIGEPSSPLNNVNGIPGYIIRDSFPGLDHWYGDYSWSRDSLKFIHSQGSGQIQISFGLEPATDNDMLMTITRMGCHPLFTKPCFPDGFDALMKSGEDNILDISYQAEFQDEWPSNIMLEFDGDRFHGQVNITRTRQNDLGTIHSDFKLKIKGKDIIHGKIDYEVGYAGEQIFIRTVTPEMSLFDMDISGKLDYTKVDPTSQDYIHSFNDHCKIVLTEHSSGNIIGKFGLGTDESGELLEWVILLSDGSTVSLYDYIVLFRKIMDYKYPNNP